MTIFSDFLSSENRLNETSYGDLSAEHIGLWSTNIQIRLMARKFCSNDLSGVEERRDWGIKTKSGITFMTRNSSMVTVQAGTKAIVPCMVRNLCDGTVSWIKRDEYQLLTVGLATYAGDERFQSLHQFNSDDWSLQIKFVQLRDAGLYECQVTSHPPSSIFIHLKVVGKINNC
ncbi:hypothetical protein O3M35_008272 [Rhynocoris fuscipes]|uniref:Ig-like domain-containing protein n=1 Tax=Rhynocoris fuscipes TaxID=488301 RepID=A0AAW1D813_9HEMI